MALRDTSTTRYEFGSEFVRIIPNNPDGGVISPTRVVSASDGPFDFSDAVLASAVTISIKTDNGSWVNDTIDLSSVSAIGAVTVAELVSAITTAAVTGLTASAEANTGFLKLALTTPGSAKYFQVKGEIADYTGMTAEIIPVNTQVSVAIEPTNKDSERIETTDSHGKITAILSDGYRQGATITVTDTAYDLALKKLLEGGTLSTVAGYAAKQYTAPGPSSVKPVVTIESFSAQYVKDDNQESNIVGYIQRKFKSCKATVGGVTGDRNFQSGVYTLMSVPYRDPISGVKDTSDMIEQVMTTAEYAALDVLNV